MINLVMPMGENIMQGRKEMQQLRDNTMIMQGKLDGIAQHGGGNRKIGILECRAAAGVRMLDSDKAAFRSWNEKLVNVFSQARTG